MKKYYRLRLLALSTTLMSLLTASAPEWAAARELTFALMGFCASRSRLGSSTEAALDLLDVLA